MNNLREHVYKSLYCTDGTKRSIKSIHSQIPLPHSAQESFFNISFFSSFFCFSSPFLFFFLFWTDGSVLGFVRAGGLTADNCVDFLKIVGIGGEQGRTHGLVGELLNSTWQTIQNRLFSIHHPLTRPTAAVYLQTYARNTQPPNIESDTGWSGTERIAG